MSDRLQFSYAVLFSTIELATYIYFPPINNFLIDKFLYWIFDHDEEAWATDNIS